MTQNVADLVGAEAQLDVILQTDPYRLDDLDIISDVLYVTGNKRKLATLAQNYMYKESHPGVCCMIGQHAQRWKPESFAHVW